MTQVDTASGGVYRWALRRTYYGKRLPFLSNEGRAAAVK